jgi:hypothetical protein
VLDSRKIDALSASQVLYGHVTQQTLVKAALHFRAQARLEDHRSWTTLYSSATASRGATSC